MFIKHRNRKVRSSPSCLKLKKICLSTITIGLIILISIIPIRLNIALHKAPKPQLILLLGGDFDRTKFAAKLWKSHKSLDIWVTDFAIYFENQRQILRSLGVANNKIRFDGRATDTVTNFTTLVDDFARQNLWHIYLVTSDYHMRRSKTIATIVLGSRGIAFTPVEVASKDIEEESWVRILRDSGRSIMWIFTGKTGASLNPRIKEIEAERLT
jgi:uncharacterized SAM-binding protein YcdF (DUF218 family)